MISPFYQHEEIAHLPWRAVPGSSLRSLAMTEHYLLHNELGIPVFFVIGVADQA
jgi:hypothetical protein